MKFHSLLLFFIFVLICSCRNENAGNGRVEYIEPQEVKVINQKIASEPENANLYYERSQIYRMLSMDSLALLDLQQSVKLDTTKSFYYSAIGDLLFDKKDISASIKWFQKAISINPNDEIAHLKIANIFLYTEDYDKAIAQINAVLKQNVYNAEAYFLKGICYRDKGETERAIACFQTAVQNEPGYFDGFMQLGLIYSKKKNPLALQYFENAIKVDSMNMQAHYAKAMFHQSQGQFADAKKVFKRSIGIDRNYAEAHYNIGWMLLQQDSVESAQREFERVIAIDPDNAKAYYNRGLCNEILGDNVKAAADYEQALVFDPEFDLPTEALERVKKK